MPGSIPQPDAYGQFEKNSGHKTRPGFPFSALTKFQDFIQNSRYNFLFFLM